MRELTLGAQGQDYHTLRASKEGREGLRGGEGNRKKNGLDQRIRGTTGIPN